MIDNLSPRQRLERIAAIIEAVDQRAMAADGPVTPTLQEMTQAEMSSIWKLASIPASQGAPENVQRDCPHCQGKGWYVVPDRATGEPAQQQCEFCLATGKLYVGAPAVSTREPSEAAIEAAWQAVRGDDSIRAPIVYALRAAYAVDFPPAVSRGPAPTVEVSRAALESALRAVETFGVDGPGFDELRTALTGEQTR